MKAYELITVCKPIIDVLSNSGIGFNDINYIDLYQEYVRMKKEGHKTTYLVAYLSEQYEVSERKVYHLIKSFEKEIA